MASPFATLLRMGKKEESERLFKKFKDELGENFYVEVQFNEITKKIDELEEGQKTINDWLVSLAKKYDVPIVLTGDVHYPEKGQDEIQTLAIAISRGVKLKDLTWELESKNLYYTDLDDFKEFNKRWGYNYKESDIEEWYHNTDKIVEKCNYEIKERNKMFLPKLTDDDDKALITKSREGLMKRFNVNNWEEIPLEYRKRLTHELEILIRKGFSNYIMILWDIYDYANREGIIYGPGRGSAASSLVLYSLYVTHLDPIEYKLMFERFLSDERSVDVVYDYFGELK
jgi:DNA polymerase-3 subunit alpha